LYRPECAHSRIYCSLFREINLLVHIKLGSITHESFSYEYNRHAKTYLPSFCYRSCAFRPFGEATLAYDRATNHPTEEAVLR
jgi:hypothetical protein